MMNHTLTHTIFSPWGGFPRIVRMCVCNYQDKTRWKMVVKKLTPFYNIIWGKRRKTNFLLWKLRIFQLPNSSKNPKLNTISCLYRILPFTPCNLRLSKTPNKYEESSQNIKSVSISSSNYKIPATQNVSWQIIVLRNQKVFKSPTTFIFCFSLA
jgi:hypothetical protein